MRLSLIIPCYNEAANLPALVERCVSLGGQTDIEVILVDNGSTDGTSELLPQLLAGNAHMRSLRVECNQGYGFGILAGLRAARGEILGWTHADLQTDPCDALRALEVFDAEGDRILVKGRRYGRPLSDTVFTVGMSIFETLLLRQPLWDINAQPTLFGRTFYSTWENAPHDFSLDLYAYFNARRVGLKVRRFPVGFGDRLHGRSHWNIDWRSKKKFILRTIAFSLQLSRSVKP